MKYRIVASPSAKDNWKKVIKAVIGKIKTNDYDMCLVLFMRDIENIKKRDVGSPSRVTDETNLVKKTAKFFDSSKPWVGYRPLRVMGFTPKDRNIPGFGTRAAETLLIKTSLAEGVFLSFDVNNFRTGIRDILSAPAPAHIDVANDSDSDDDFQAIQIQFHDGTPAGRLTHLIDTILEPAWASDVSEAYRVRSQLLTVLADELGVKVKVPTSVDDNTFDLNEKIQGYLAKMPKDLAIA
jgi:hypothetical protein